MQNLLHHGHWIPVLRGFTRAHVAEQFPRLDLERDLAVCRAASIVDPQSGGGSPLRCDPRVRVFHFTNEQVFAVEWTTGPSPRAVPFPAAPIRGTANCESASNGCAIGCTSVAKVSAVARRPTVPGRSHDGGVLDFCPIPAVGLRATVDISHD